MVEGENRIRRNKPLPRSSFNAGEVNNIRTKSTEVTTPLPCSTFLEKSQITDKNKKTGHTHKLSRGLTI